MVVTQSVISFTLSFICFFLKDSTTKEISKDKSTAVTTLTDMLCLPMTEMFEGHSLAYTAEEYRKNLEYLSDMEMQYENLTVNFSDKLTRNTLIYVKEDTGVFMAKVDTPITAFTINESNMVSAFWDCMEKKILF